jgi:hypothetical protein
VAAASPAAEGAVTAVALGPVLGAMDSTTVKTEVVCTPRGIGVTAVITRSADYTGAALANVNWRPKMQISALVRRPDAVLQVTWKMRSSNGETLDRAATPPYPQTRYPISVTKALEQP